MRVLDDGGYDGQPCGLCGSPATLTHDQLKNRRFYPVRTLTRPGGQLFLRNGPHHHRLQYPDLTDRMDQLVHLVIAECFAWLLRIRPDGEHWEFRKTGSRDGREVKQRRGCADIRPRLLIRSNGRCFT